MKIKSLVYIVASNIRLRSEISILRQTANNLENNRNDNMEKLLTCPICGKIPILKSLEPEYSSYKYFCSVHVSCGDWKDTEDKAKKDWNRRVQEYQDALLRTETPGTPEFLEKVGNLKAYVYCEDCDYETDTMTMKNLLLKLSMEGGYIVSDKNGGYSGKCPKCGSEKLTIGS